MLVVDDSLLFREVLAQGIGSDPALEVVAKATDPFDATSKIMEFVPDVITCDVEMPGMNGIEFIRRLLPQYPVPVIVVSTISHSVFEAMGAGAVDFVTKPDIQTVADVAIFFRELILKIKIASTANISVKKLPGKEEICAPEEGNPVYRHKLIAIGASTGGTEALSGIIQTLPATVPCILIVQHIPPVFSRMFAERLNRSSPLKVKEAETNDTIENGKVLIAPGDRHMRIKKVGDSYRVECYEGERVNGHCPSVDVLFESVAHHYGKYAVGVILTGMGYDGAKGLLSMRAKGARTIGQDEKSCVVYGMPKVAYSIGAVEEQVPLQRVANSIMSVLKSSKP